MTRDHITTALAVALAASLYATAAAIGDAYGLPWSWMVGVVLGLALLYNHFERGW